MEKRPNDTIEMLRAEFANVRKTPSTAAARNFLFILIHPPIFLLLYNL